VSATDAKGNVARRSGTFRTRSVQTLGDGGPTSFDSGSGCAVQCITGATASVGSHDAQIEIDTLVSARVSVQADPKAPVQSAHGPVFEGDVAAQVSGVANGRHWEGTLDGLYPGVRYHVIVRATDANRRTAWREGTLETDGRHARVKFTSIKVVGDADKGANRGEINFKFWVRGQIQPHLRRGEDKIKSGGRVGIPNGGEVVMHDIGKFMEIRVQGEERDPRGCPGWVFDSGGEALHHPLMGKRKDECSKWEWSTAGNAFDLDTQMPEGALPPGYGDAAGMQNFELRQDRGRLRFKVYGGIEVWYE
jgi:hypothetical protein